MKVDQDNYIDKSKLSVNDHDSQNKASSFRSYEGLPPYSSPSKRTKFYCIIGGNGYNIIKNVMNDKKDW